MAAGIAVGAISLGGSTTTSSVSRDRVVVASANPPTTALLRVSSARTELDASNLAAPAPGRVYEVWLQRRGEPRPTDALFTPTSDGRATVAVPGDLRGVDAVMVTDEPSGGSLKPTRLPPVIQAPLH